MDRTSAAGKASSVQFIHFPFADAQIAAFRSEGEDVEAAGGAGAAAGTEVVVGFCHPEYAHMTVLPRPARQVFSQDFD